MFSILGKLHTLPGMVLGHLTSPSSLPLSNNLFPERNIESISNKNLPRVLITSTNCQEWPQENLPPVMINNLDLDRENEVTISHQNRYKKYLKSLA